MPWKRYLPVSLQFGIAGAALVVLYFFTFYWLGDNSLMRLSSFDILIVLICMVFAMGFYRDRRNGGKMQFWEGLLIGLFTNLLATLLSVLVIYIFIAFIDTGVVTRHITALRALMADNRPQMNIGADAYEQTLQQIAATTPLVIAVDVFIKKFLICLLATGVFAAVLRKQ